MGFYSIDPQTFEGGSRGFKRLLKANSSPRGVQVYSISGFTVPRKVDWLFKQPFHTSVDQRGTQYNQQAPAPCTQTTTLRDLYLQHWSEDDLRHPTTHEAIFYTSSCVPVAYASGTELSKISYNGNKYATLTDYSTPEADDEDLMLGFGHRYDHCFYAPSNIAASDDGLGACGYMDPGIASAVAIFSSRYSAARLHAEDGFLGSSNLLVKGAPKVWYVVAPSYASTFKNSICSTFAKHSLASKSVYPRNPSPEQIEAGHITRIVQYPGDLVITEPGCVFHWTLSCGTNICESSNYYIDMGKSFSSCVDECLQMYSSIGNVEDAATHKFCQERIDCCHALKDMSVER